MVQIQIDLNLGILTKKERKNKYNKMLYQVKKISFVR